MTNVNTDSTDQGLVLGDKALVMEVFAKHGFPALSSAAGEEKTIEAGADQMYQGKGADDSSKIEASTPG